MNFVCVCVICLNLSQLSEAFINDMVQEGGISNSLVMEMLRSCSEPSMYASENYVIIGSGGGLVP